MVRGTVRALKISRGDSVSRSRAREFRCPVVQETVEIRLRRSGGFGRPNGYFVQCNQLDCQYVEENKPPCPLRSEEHTSELQSPCNLVCRLLLEKKKNRPPVQHKEGKRTVKHCDGTQYLV